MPTRAKRRSACKRAALPLSSSPSTLAAQQPLPSPWNTSSRPELFVIALFSNGTCAVTACWLRKMQQMMIAADGMRYKVQIGFFNHGDDHDGRRQMIGARFGSALWRRSSRAKAAMVLRLLHANAARDHSESNRLYLWCDLDVLPLRPYSVIVDHFMALEQEATRRGTQRTELLFMREPHSSCGGMTPWVANTGFIMMRNSAPVRGFWRWLEGTTRGGKMYDQDVANWLLLKRLKPGDVGWALLPTRLVGTDVDAVDSDLVGFHAVGVTGHAKFLALQAAWRQHLRHEARAHPALGSADGFGCDANESFVQLPEGWRRSSGQYAAPRVLHCR
jgi:hypothetical protein